MSVERKIPTLGSRGRSDPRENDLSVEFLRNLIDRANIETFIEPHVALKKAGASMVGLCPFHKEKSPSFSVTTEKGLYYCFGCGKNGDAITFLREYAGLSFREAVQEVADSVGMVVPNGRAGPSIPERAPAIYQKMDLANKFFRHCLKYSDSTKEYLKSRGVVPSTLNEFAIGYAPQGWNSLKEVFGEDEYKTDPDLVTSALLREKDGRRYDYFRDRLMFGIRDSRGRIVAFGGRSMDGSEPKYLNTSDSPVFDKGSTLYGLHEARSEIQAKKRVIVVEGYMGVVMPAQFGIRNIVATMGTACTEQQIERLCSLAPHVVFCFDGDLAGQRAAWRAMERCLPFATERHSFSFCLMPDGMDPDDYVRKEGPVALNALFDGGKTLSQFMIGQLSERNNNLDTPEDRARFLSDGMELLRRLPYGGALYRILRDELTKTANVGISYLASLNNQRRRQSSTADLWSRLEAAVKAYPVTAGSKVEDVIASMSEEDYGFLEAEEFSSDTEKTFWEVFLSLPEVSHVPEKSPETQEEISMRDMAIAVVELVGSQLSQQRRKRLTNMYRKGELEEEEFIKRRGSVPVSN